MNSDEPSETPAKPSSTCDGENARKRASGWVVSSATRLDPDRLQLFALAVGELVEPEARLQREDGDVDPVAVERPQPRLRLVVAEVDLESALAR